MKKIVCFCLALILMTGCSSTSSSKDTKKNIAFLEKYGKENVEVPFKKLDITAKVPTYQIESDLSNVVNRKSLEEFTQLTPELTEKLRKNGFIVVNGEYGHIQPFKCYEINEYFAISNFVTTDSVIHLYHVFYDHMLRNLEEKEFLPKIKEWNKEFLQLALQDFKDAKDEKVKSAALSNAALFITSAKILNQELSQDLPKEAIKLAEEEFNKISRASESTVSSLTRAQVDYSQFIPRGHYTRSDDLKMYFKVLMLYSQEKFFVEDRPDLILQAALLTRNIYSNKQLFAQYDDIYKILNFLVENSEDIDFYKMGKAVYSVYDQDADCNQFADEKLFQELEKEVQQLPKPQIQVREGKYFAVFAQRAVVDSIWIQKLLDTENEVSKRPLPSALDVMAVLGSPEAKEIQLAKPENKYWDQYSPKLEDLTKEVSNYKEEFWKHNLYRGWLWMIQDIIKPVEKGYPQFMTTKEWALKNLNSAMGSYTELKHDTLLYGKQSSAEMGGGELYPVASYVEPNVNFYNKLDWLLNNTMENLKARALLSENQEKGFQNFISLNSFLLDCSKKELENIPLSDEDQKRLTYIGGEMENIFLNFVDPTKEYFEQIENSADANMQIVADIMKTGVNDAQVPAQKYLELGINQAQDIYVVYPVKGKLYIGRGAVFDSYEFLSDKRLNDEEWRMMRREDMEKKGILRPSWTKAYSINATYP